jgi:Zn-dependent protease with chaperone function
MWKLLVYAGVVAAASACAADPPDAADAPLLGSTALPDRKSLVDQLETLKEVRTRWQGEKVFLDAEYGADPGKSGFRVRFRAIAERFGIDPPDVILVKPPLDRKNKPRPQKPDAGIAWGVVDGKYHDVVFITEYLKAGLNDEELLAALAHEMGHVSQAKNTGHHPQYIRGRKMESEADAYALSCPEVDPAAFRSMVINVDKLADAAGRAHPLLFGDGSTAVIPVSVQNKLVFGGDHPMTSTRVKRAEAEIKRRADASAKQPETALPVPAAPLQ